MPCWKVGLSEERVELIRPVVWRDLADVDSLLGELTAAWRSGWDVERLLGAQWVRVCVQRVLSLVPVVGTSAPLRIDDFQPEHLGKLVFPGDIDNDDEQKPSELARIQAEDVTRWQEYLSTDDDDVPLIDVIDAGSLTMASLIQIAGGAEGAVALAASHSQGQLIALTLQWNELHMPDEKRGMRRVKRQANEVVRNHDHELRRREQEFFK